MKNVVIVDIDTDREQAVQIMKPSGGGVPSNAEEAQNMVAMDIRSLTEGLVTLVIGSHLNDYSSKEDNFADIVDHLRGGLTLDENGIEITDEEVGKNGG